MRKAILAVTVTFLLAAPLAARPKPAAGTPASVDRLFACRGISDSTQRLACFDREVGSIATAVSTRQLVMVDHQRAQATRRELFGLSIPSFGGLFGKDDADQINQIESVVTSVGHNPDGGLAVRLADGSLWSQTDDAVLGLDPRKGDKIVVKRGSLGSYWVIVNGQSGFKARRIA